MIATGIRDEQLWVGEMCRVVVGGCPVLLVRHESGGAETTLAGTERELSTAVVELLGLEFEQFTKTCVLPQGAFADFLHADKRERQKLLRQLLDVGVYETMGKLARARAEETSTRAQLLQEQLDADPAMSDDELAALEARAEQLLALAQRLPGLLEALQTTDETLAGSCFVRTTNDMNECGIWACGT